MNPFWIKSFYNFLGATSIGNGLWMLFFAANWYQYLPAAIEDTGPLNVHFVHDIGLVYTISGIAALWCARNLKICMPVHYGLTFFVVGHALIHVVEIILGLLPPSHWLIDFPLIFVPALGILALTPFVSKLNKAAKA